MSQSTTDGEEDTQVCKADIRANWPHETPYGWDMCSQESIVPCSLEVPLTQESPPDSPILTGRRILVPETPQQTKIDYISKNMQDEGYTVYTNKMADGKIMHMAFRIYDPW
jgi:hypothetical protein